MSETFIFIIGLVVFAVTVYGSVMAAGIALTRAEIEQDPTPRKLVDDEVLDKRVPLVKY